MPRHQVVTMRSCCIKWRRGTAKTLPDDDDDAVKDVVRVPQVVEGAEGGELEDHLQREHAGEHDVADLQNVGQLLGLSGTNKRPPSPFHRGLQKARRCMFSI